MTKYYVYILVDPTNNLPFYVGKGCGDRWLSHYRETLTNTTNKRKFYKIRQLKELGFEPKVLFWAKELDEYSAYELEKKLIERFGRKRYDEGGVLLNICIDANPPGMNSANPDQHRKKLSVATKGRKKPADFGAKVSKALTGKPKSESHRKAIGDVHRGKIVSAEQRKKISIASKGRVVSPETKEKLRQAALRREANKRANK